MPFKNHFGYWAAVGPGVEVFLSQRKDALFESCLVEALALYSFVQEDFPAKAQQHAELVPKLATLIVVPQWA